MVLLNAFCEDRNATEAARLSGVSVRSINAIYGRLRARLIQSCFTDPLAWGGARMNLESALQRRGYVLGAAEPEVPILYEIIRCVPRELLARISCRGIRPASLINHAIEIYIRRKCEISPRPYFLSNFDKEYDANIIAAVRDLQGGDMRSFRRKLSLLSPAPYKSDVTRFAFDDFYSEFESILIRNPI